MQAINLKDKKFDFHHKEWDNFQFVNHGMGFLRVEEHEQLIKDGAIKCGFGQDVINANYPFVKITKDNGESTTIDVGGSLLQARQEVASLQRQGKKATVGFYPKAYFEHIERQYKKPDEEMKELAESFGGSLEEIQF